MDILKVVLATIGSIIALFFLTRLIGNKQISEMNMFDYINGITIGSIAAEMATTVDGEFLKPLVAMALYAVITFMLSLISIKYLPFRRFIDGKSLFLFDKGKIYVKNLKKAKLDVSAFLAQCRVMGYFKLDDVESVILEPNGKLSVLPKAEKRPCNPSDFALSVPTQRPEVNIIIDGIVLEKNLHYTGNGKSWLEAQLQKQKKTIKDVFLGTCDEDNNLKIYEIKNQKHLNDIFQ